MSPTYLENAIGRSIWPPILCALQHAPASVIGAFLAIAPTVDDETALRLAMEADALTVDDGASWEIGEGGDCYLVDDYLTDPPESPFLDAIMVPESPAFS